MPHNTPGGVSLSLWCPGEPCCQQGSVVVEFLLVCIQRLALNSFLLVYRSSLQRISEDPLYHRPDFGVEYFSLLSADPPTKTEGGKVVPDGGVLAPDCFHFTKDLQGTIARYIYIVPSSIYNWQLQSRHLWNNLFQQTDCSVNFNERPELFCPLQHKNYFRGKGQEQ